MFEHYDVCDILTVPIIEFPVISSVYILVVSREIIPKTWLTSYHNRFFLCFTYQPAETTLFGVCTPIW